MIQYKATFEFISRLDKFVLHIENNYFKATDVKLTKYITIPAGFIGEQFKQFHRYPLRQRFETMTDYILEMMKFQFNLTITTAEKNLLKREIKNMFAGNNDLQIYKDFFQWTGKPEMFKMRKNRMPEYAVLAAIAYLHIALNGSNPQSCDKHLLIDGMQDYSPIQGDSETISLPKNDSKRCFPIRESLRFFHSRQDSESIYTKFWTAP